MTTSNRFNIVLLPGDGVGPEVVDASLPVLKVVERFANVQFDCTTIPGGGAHYSEFGTEWPDGSLEKVRAADAVILGAVGHDGPDGKVVRRGDGELAGYELVVGLRKNLDLYTNVRPVKLFPGVEHRIHGELQQVWQPEKVDMVIIRENTEDAYVPGSFRLERNMKTEMITSPIIITRVGSERVIRRSFELARRRNGAPADGKRRVTCVDKSNIIQAHRLFRQVFDEVASEFPDVERDYAYVDAFCQWLVRTPEYFDVVVAPNFSGDVITDLAAVLQGGLGVAAGGNIGDDHAMFEPIHGSAPKHAGLDKVNPVACILAVRMMVDWLGTKHGLNQLVTAGDKLEFAVQETLKTTAGRTYDLGGSARCSEVGRAISEKLALLLEV